MIIADFHTAAIALRPNQVDTPAAKQQELNAYERQVVRLRLKIG